MAAPPPLDAGTWSGPQREAVLAALNTLLEAERAGARVALETGRAVSDPQLAELVARIHQDELRWCAMLLRAVRDLGATPSALTGAFHGKAMAIADLAERLAFLNRGQGWVARKLRELLQQPLPEPLRAELAAMLAAHEANIDLVNAALPPHAS